MVVSPVMVDNFSDKVGDPYADRTYVGNLELDQNRHENMPV